MYPSDRTNPMASQVTALEITGATVATLASIREMSPHATEFAPTEPLEEIVNHFGQRPEAFAVLVMDGPKLVHLISREWLAEQLSRPYFRELFFRKPVSNLLQFYGVPPLVLAETTTIPIAIEQVLSRPGQSRYQPAAVVGADQVLWVLDVYSLLLQQCRMLASTLRELEEQRKATLAAEADREKLQRRLVDASREAGRAEVATGILHNVGNVLNSVNVSVSVVNKAVQQSKVGNLLKALDMIHEAGEGVAEFLTHDERGRRLPGYLTKLGRLIADEQSTIQSELSSLGQSLDHIGQVVAMQQLHAKDSNLREEVRPDELMEDALRVNVASFDRHNIQVDRDYAPMPRVPLDKHKVLQILINLVSNAKNAVKHRAPQPMRITLKIQRIERADGAIVRFQVADNGVGISSENQTMIFVHGFTTRKEGHGFGLHSAANAAREMGGSLTATSPGLNQGATFTLDVPLHVAAQKVAA